MVKNPRANAILECTHQDFGQMLHTAGIDMAKSVTPNYVNVSSDNAAWAIWSTYHNILKASPGAAIFGWDMLFDIPFLANWHKIGEYRQSLTDRSNQRKNTWHIDYEYKVGDKVLVMKEGILHKSESKYGTCHGLSQQFIQMELSGFNAEPEWKDWHKPLTSVPYKHTFWCTRPRSDTRPVRELDCWCQLLGVRDNPMQRSHHLSLGQYLEYHKISLQETMQKY